jgi:hypothetical protein
MLPRSVRGGNLHRPFSLRLAGVAILAAMRVGELRRLVQESMRLLGRIDVLVNNVDMELNAPICPALWGYATWNHRLVNPGSRGARCDSCAATRSCRMQSDCSAPSGQRRCTPLSRADRRGPEETRILHLANLTSNDNAPHIPALEASRRRDWNNVWRSGIV